MVLLSDIVKQIEAAQGEFLNDQVVRRFKDNILKAFKTVGAAKIKAALLGAYDRLAEQQSSEFGSAVAGKDPTDLAALKPLFEAQISRELENNITVEDDAVVIQVMNEKDLGYEGSGKPEKAQTGGMNTVDVLVFYIEGMIGPHAFITLEQYQKFKKARGGNPGSAVGRFGKGFMLTKENYEAAGFPKITGKSFSEVRHPISDQKPYRGFTDALDTLDFSDVFEMALKNTEKELDGSVFKGSKS